MCSKATGTSQGCAPKRLHQTKCAPKWLRQTKCAPKWLCQTKCAPKRLCQNKCAAKQLRHTECGPILWEFFKEGFGVHSLYAEATGACTEHCTKAAVCTKYALKRCRVYWVCTKAAWMCTACVPKWIWHTLSTSPSGFSKYSFCARVYGTFFLNVFWKNSMYSISHQTPATAGMPATK